MKISLPTLSLFTLICGQASALGNADKFYHERPAIGPSMWLFGTEGVYIYSVDGTKQIKHLKNTDICESVIGRSGKPSQDCGYKVVVSDGQKYVWASNTQGSGRVDVFDIDTGDFVASNPVCSYPWDLDYHPSREEVWVQCWSPKAVEGDDGHIDVISINAISSDAKQVATGDGLEFTGHGTVIVDSSLGPNGYGTVLSSPALYKIDLDRKEVKHNVTLPDAAGLFRMQFSPANKHLYIRAYICCTCGGSDSDYGEDCRNPDSLVDVKTGPNAGKMQVPGLCGHSCEGTAADTIGLYEYDTVTDTVVGTINAPDGLSGNPFAAPDGSFIAMLGNDGGNFVRILEPTTNGSPSRVAKDVQLGFSTIVGEVGISNVEVIKDSTHNLAIFTSTLANYIVLMDLSDYSIHKLELTTADDISSNHGRGAKRSISWAVGSNYVWVDANAVSEQYVIELDSGGDIKKAKVARTLSDLPSRTLLYVENYMSQKNNVADNVAAADLTNLADNPEVIELLRSMQTPNQETKSESSSNDAIGIAALVIGCVGSVLALFSLVLATRNK